MSTERNKERLASICRTIAKRGFAAQILLFYRFSALFGKVPASEAEEHLRHNKANWDKRSEEVTERCEDGKRYLEHQRRLGDSNDHSNAFYFGRQRDCKPFQASYNSCEVIAVYNLEMFFEGKACEPFPEWIHRFERKGIALKGLIGSAPSAMERYIRKPGRKVEKLVGKAYENADLKAFGDAYEAFIVNLYNDGSTLQAGIHSMCITKANDDRGSVFRIHNDYATYGRMAYHSLREAIEGYNGGKSKVIVLYGVKREDI